MSNEELSSREVIEEVYNCFKYKLDEKFDLEMEAKEMKLDPAATVEVADDSDWHRTKKGYMIYKKALVWKRRKWQALALGNPRGSYPIEPYLGDLAATVKFDDASSQEKIRNRFEEGMYFRQSLLVAKRDGGLIVSENPMQLLNNELRERLEKIKECFQNPEVDLIAEELEVDEEHITLNLQRPVKQTMKYKPQAVDYIFEKLANILIKTN